PSRSEEHRLAVRAVDAFQRVPDLVEGAVGAGAIEHGPDDVLVLERSLSQRLQPFGHEAVVAFGPEPREPAPLARLRVVRDLEDLDRVIVVAREVVDPTMTRSRASNARWNRSAERAICCWNQPPSMPRTTPPTDWISANSASASRSSCSVSDSR